MATYTGTANNDYLAGTASADSIYGYGGNDALVGHAGADYIDGGSGNDSVVDGDGQNPDTSADTLLGGDGDDTVYAGYLDNADGGTGTADTLVLRLDYAPGSFSINFTSLWSGGTYVIDGATVQRFEKLQWVVATAYGDSITLGTPAGQTAEAAGRGGGDTLVGGTGNDILNADFFYNYAVVADTAYDILLGGDGNDMLTGGLGDYLDGGNGSDQLILDAGMSASGVSLDFNTLIATGSDTLLGTAMYGFEDVAGVYGSLYNDVINVSSENYGTTLLGRDGSDTLTGGTGNDRLDGGDGNDILAGGSGADQLAGGLGNDVYTMDGSDTITEAANAGIDEVRTTIAAYTLGANLEHLTGTSAAGQSLTGNAISNTLNGGGGNDILEGVVGNDTLNAGSGADVLIGGTGADSLRGNAGADVFRYNAATDSTAAATDLIGDFAVGLDRIDLSGIDANTLAGGDQAFQWIGANAFAGTGAASAGELRVYQSGAHWWAAGDTNGDGTADLVIAFTPQGAILPGQGDFLL